METALTGLATPAEATPQRTRADVWREALLVPCMIFALTRAFLLFFAWNAHRMMITPKVHSSILLPASDPLSRLGDLARPWFRFDAGWYAGVVQHGYHWGTLGHANTNFMPLFPLVSRMIEPLALGSPWFATWAVANLFCLTSLILLWRWTRLHLPRQRAAQAVLLLAVFPFAFFYSAPYAESLFLTLAIAAFLLAEEGHWNLAIAAAGLSTVTRPVGPAVVLGLLVLAYSRGDKRHAAFSLAGMLPLAVFALYLGVAFGHPLGFTTYHTDGWVAPHGGVLATLSSQFNTTLSPFDRVDAFLAVLFLASGVLAWRRFGPAYGTFVLIGCLLPLTRGLAGMERYVIVLFPAFGAWATLGSSRLQMALFAISMLLTAAGVSMFAAGYTLI